MVCPIIMDGEHKAAVPERRNQKDSRSFPNLRRCNKVFLHVSTLKFTCQSKEAEGLQRKIHSEIYTRWLSSLQMNSDWNAGEETT